MYVRVIISRKTWARARILHSNHYREVCSWFFKVFSFPDFFEKVMIFEFVPNMHLIFIHGDKGTVAPSYKILGKYACTFMSLFQEKHELGVGYCRVIILGKFVVDFLKFFLFPIFLKKWWFLSMFHICMNSVLRDYGEQTHDSPYQILSKYICTFMSLFQEKHELGLGYCMVIILGKFFVDFLKFFFFRFFEKVMIFESVPNKHEFCHLRLWWSNPWLGSRLWN